MPVEVIMPKVDMDMASGRIMTWHIAEGATVSKGDALFSIETDKAAMEIEASGNGALHHLEPEGTEVAIGEPVAWLYAEGETVGERPGTTMPADGPPLASPPGSQDGTRSTEGTGGKSGEDGEEASNAKSVRAADVRDGVRATPRARSLARDADLDLAAVRGSGPRGRIQRDDVLSARGATGAMSVASGFVPGPNALSITRSRGGKGVPIVLIHGFASDSTSWAPLEAQLDSRPLIRIDLPGHGRSPMRPVEDFATLAAEVRGAFDALGLERVHLIGHSLGGALCLALSDTRAESVASLSLIAPAGLGPDIDGAVLSGICRASRAESLGPWLKELVVDTALVTDSYVRLAMATRAEPGLRAAQTAMAEALFPDGVQAFDLRPALERIAVPTRIVWGKRDRIMPWRHALRAPGRIGLHLFDSVGHMPQLEAAGEVAKVVAPVGR